MTFAAKFKLNGLFPCFYVFVCFHIFMYLLIYFAFSRILSLSYSPSSARGPEKWENTKRNTKNTQRTIKSSFDEGQHQCILPTELHATTRYKRGGCIGAPGKSAIYARNAVVFAAVENHTKSPKFRPTAGAAA